MTNHTIANNYNSVWVNYTKLPMTKEPTRFFTSLHLNIFSERHHDKMSSVRTTYICSTIPLFSTVFISSHQLISA